MLVNVIITLVLLALVALCIGYMMRTLRRGKKEGVGVACLGCSAYKSGQCAHHGACSAPAGDAVHSRARGSADMLNAAQAVAVHPCEVNV